MNELQICRWFILPILQTNSQLYNVHAYAYCYVDFISFIMLLDIVMLNCVSTKKKNRKLKQKNMDLKNPKLRAEPWREAALRKKKGKMCSSRVLKPCQPRRCCVTMRIQWNLRVLLWSFVSWMQSESIFVLKWWGSGFGV